MFSGDTLFPGGPGNTKFENASFDQIIESIDRRLFTLPGGDVGAPGARARHDHRHRAPPPRRVDRPGLVAEERRRVSEQNDRAARELEAARARTLALLEPISEAGLIEPHSALMSPLVWDLAHIGHYEELWLVPRARRRGADRSAVRRRLRRVPPPALRTTHARHPRPRGRARLRGGRPQAVTRRAGRRRPRFRRPAPRGWVRLRPRGPPRGPARRDDAGHHPAHGRRAPGCR